MLKHQASMWAPREFRVSFEEAFKVFQNGPRRAPEQAAICNLPRSACGVPPKVRSRTPQEVPKNLANASKNKKNERAPKSKWPFWKAPDASCICSGVRGDSARAPPGPSEDGPNQTQNSPRMAPREPLKALKQWAPCNLHQVASRSFMRPRNWARIYPPSRRGEDQGRERRRTRKKKGEDEEEADDV